MQIAALLSFIGYTAIVALYAWHKTHKENLNSQDGYFLGGRSLTGIFIAGSLILTNLSTEQIVGLNGQSYAANMSVMAWEVTSPLALIVMALVFLPRYLKSGITTIPNFLEERYDRKTRQIISVLFLLGYAVTYLPTVLYSGALVLDELFGISDILNMGKLPTLFIIIFLIGFVGTLYVVFGGLKGCAVSDTLNGVGLMIGGFLIPVLALIKLGDGSFASGINQLITVHPEKLNAIGDSASPVPFITIFTGLLFNNLFYWGTNQSIVQRTFGAKNLAEGQKGVLLAGLFKVFGAFYLVLPGVIAFHIFGGSLANSDTAYPMLVSTVLPKPLMGFFAAVLFGAILSSFNGALNSSITLFTLDIYKPIFKPQASDKDVVKVGRKVAIILALVSICVAPFILYAPSGLYYYLQECFGFYNIPILAAIVVGFFSKRVPAIAPKIALVVHIVLYTLSKIFLKDINFLYILGVLFPLAVIIMLIVGKIKPRDTDYVQKYTKQVEIKPWKHVKIASVAILIIMVLVYILFSKIGIAG